MDRKLKRNLYGRYDVLEYWLFDPDLRLAEIFRRDEAGHLVKAAEYEDEGELTSPLLPGLVIDLKLLWPEEV
ncbi:Uma2 family endonuclease [Neomoorella mulderi]|uniref:Uma2 family endonuclease n=1 Tax=Neomoorella mulderi TaxID=202604 RepID=UPI000A000DE7|nr:Uma2 family endonuclease [Moorella mulderi]